MFHSYVNVSQRIPEITSLLRTCLDPKEPCFFIMARPGRSSNTWPLLVIQLSSSLGDITSILRVIPQDHDIKIIKNQRINSYANHQEQIKGNHVLSPKVYLSHVPPFWLTNIHPSTKQKTTPHAPDESPRVGHWPLQRPD